MRKIAYNIIGATCLIPLLPLSAAVLTDPTLASEIDPTGAATIDAAAPGAMSQATLEGMSNFYVLQDFTGFSNGTAANYAAFTDSAFPDIKFQASGGASDNNSGGANTSTGLNTSPGTAIRLFNNSGGSRTINLTIDFGNYTGTFDGSVNAVGAAGFALTNLSDINGATVRFYDASETVISTQTVTNTVDNVFFGYDNSANSGISKILVSASFDGGSSSIGFDDLGYTIVPEPSTYALGLGLAMGALTFMRRSRRGIN